ncbi:hypothetical protein [Phycicoccus duodecadis]|uniref:DUF4386 family protein n=1 Tax=Phycicoccus duodecadis TaxID=173053 RepID=A0A2N3YG16_9MICO|nr:hypothetical protein [Phycicoccus duodecadis]PKW25779.1 hypothetical protein ATL31_0579 [Phycicoccus duodecadis]
MSVFTHNPARSDVSETPSAGTTHPAPRGWAVAGVVAGLAGLASVVLSGMVDPVYREDLRGDAQGMTDALGGKVGILLGFHTATMVAAVALLVFGIGLHRRLAARATGSLAPGLAAGGLVGTAVVLVLGAGLDTEFISGVMQPGLVQPSAAVFYNHWVGTIPWCWVLAGLAGTALHTAARGGTVPRWLGRFGLVAGGLVLLLGVSPLQYMAGFVAPVLVVGAALGFLVGDRAFRTAR